MVKYKINILQIKIDRFFKMKKSLLLLLAFFSFVYLFSQNKKHIISVSIGAASPKEEFSETNLSKDESGFAETGLALGLDYQYNFHPNFGGTFMLRSLGYTFDTAEKLREYNKLNSRFDYTARSDAYGLGFIGIGVIGQFGTDQLKVYLNPFFGSSSLLFPKQTDTAKDDVSFTTKEIESTNARGLTYGFAFGLKYYLSDLISLGVNFEYTKSQDYEVRKTFKVYDNHGNYLEGVDEYKQSFSSFNSMLKLGFNF